MRTSVKLLAGISAAVALVLPLSACSTGSAAPKPTATISTAGAHPTTFTVGVFAPDVTFATFYAAIGDTGTLAKTLKREKVTLKIQYIPSGPNLVAALAGGSVDAAVLPATGLIALDAHGSKLVPLVGLFDGPSQQLIAQTKFKASKGTKVSAFAGERWAYTAGGESQVTVQQAVAGAGLKWSSLNTVPISGGAAEASLAANQVDIAMTNPATAAAAVVAKDAYLVQNPQANNDLRGANQINATLATSPKFVAQYPAFSQTVVTSIIDELNKLKTSSSAAAALSLMPADFVSAESKSWGLQWQWSKTGFTRATGGFSTTEVSDTVGATKDARIVPSNYKLDPSLFNNKYVIKAYKALGLKLPQGLS